MWSQHLPSKAWRSARSSYRMQPSAQMSDLYLSIAMLTAITHKRCSLKAMRGGDVQHPYGLLRKISGLM